MATQQSTSTRIPSGNPRTEGEWSVLHYFMLATKLLQQSQAKTARNAPVSLQLNHGQCRYLVKKLEMAVQSARESMSLSSPREDTKDWKLIGKWKFLVRLAIDVQRFIQECCEKKYWIQAASMLINAFEHVDSLDSHLELCIWSFKNSGRIILETALRRELISISDAHDRRTGDLDKLLKKAGVTLKVESFENLQGDKLAASLLGELEAALAINPVTIDQRTSLAELSVHDHVDLLKRVAAFSPGSFPHPDLEQIATSLAQRFLVSVGDPFSENTNIDFMKVECASLPREGKLGRGGFGVVYRVQWLGIPAAEKVLFRTSLLSDFVKEVSILARQSHPNIVRLLCYVKRVPNKDDPIANQSPNEDDPNANQSLNEDDPNANQSLNEDDPNANQSEYSMLQELMQKDLSSLIEERMKLSDGAPFSIDEVVDILLQIAEGIAYLHRRKVLHRDLKPQNILVKCDKREEIASEYILAKVADFGISKTKEKTITLSQPTKNVGSSRWMAPEVIGIRNKRGGGYEKVGDWDPFWNLCKCDVYSFGMVSYEVLTGEKPFVNASDRVVMENVWRGVRPPLPLKYPFCLRSMIQKCWRGEPEERPSFAEICTELRFMKGALLIGWDL